MSCLVVFAGLGERVYGRWQMADSVENQDLKSLVTKRGLWQMADSVENQDLKSLVTKRGLWQIADSLDLYRSGVSFEGFIKSKIN